MSGPPRPELDRPRDVGTIVADAFGLLWRRRGQLLPLALAIVVPVDVIVEGIGLRRIGSEFRETDGDAALAISLLADQLVIIPLMVAAAVAVLRQAGASRRGALEEALGRFTLLLGAMLLMTAGVALGLLALVVPGIYLGVRWYVTAPVVVLEQRAGVDALRRSGELVTGSWWRTFGAALLIFLAGGALGAVVYLPLVALANALDSGTVELLAITLGDILTAPYVALAMVLLYYDLHARARGEPGQP